MTPGVCGLQQAGTAKPLNLLAEGMHRRPLRRILSANAGFGGLNGAVVLSSIAQQTQSSSDVGVAQRGQLIFDQAGHKWQCADDSRYKAWPERLVTNIPGELPRFTSLAVTGQRDSSWGRMDQFSRLAVTLAHYTRRQLGSIPPQCGMILLSERSCAESDRQCERNRQQGIEDPQRFAYTLPSTALGEVSIRLGIKGPAMALPGASDSQGELTAHWLIKHGQPMVLLMRVEADRGQQLAWLNVYTPNN